MPRGHTNGSWPIIQTTPRFSNSLVGFTTKTDLRFKIRRLRSLTSQGVSRPVRSLHYLGPIDPSHQSHALDPHDAQSWYLLGRAYMAGQKYNKAYEAYQQAVYRDGRNPTFWCSIGVLYFQINQYRDALDAYSRAIRINPYISEVWFDLGSLYESCNNQISDAIDAYARAAELDPRNTAITQRLELLKQAQATGAQLPAAPGPQDVHPTAYANTVVQPPGLTGPPLLLQGSNANRVTPRGDLRNGDSSLPLPPPPNTVGPGRPTSPRPFRGGPPPPVIVDESRHNQSRLAPMDLDRPPTHSRDPPSLYPSSRGPSTSRHSSILLHQPVPQPPPSDSRNGHPPHSHDPHFASRQIRPPSTSTSPIPRGHTPRTSSYSNHPSQRPPPPGLSHPPRSPRPYPTEVADRDSRRDDRDWDRERRGRHIQDYAAPPPHQMFATRGHSPPYRGHSPGPRSARDYSPPQPSPRNAHQSVPSRSYPSPWAENKPAVPRSPPTQPLPEPHPSRRYDPRNDGRDPRELRDYDPMDTRPDLRSRPPSHHGSPESVRNTLRQPPPPPAYSKRSPSPHLPSHPGIQISENRVPGRRRGSQREKEPEPPYSPGSLDAKRDRKRKNPTGPMIGMRRKEEDSMYIDRPPNNGQPSFRVNTYPPRVESPEPVSSGGSVIRSVHQSPTAAPVPPKRYVDEDYDEGVAEVLMDLASYRTHVPASQPLPLPPVQGPSGRASPRPLNSHRGSISSNRGDRDSPALSTGSSQKRPLSPTSEDNGGGEMKRPKVDGQKLSPTSKQTPIPSTRPSPVPFRTQAALSSPVVRQLDAGHYRQASPPLPAVLPPHPRPVGSGMALPPIATISPTSSGSPGRDEDRMAVDRPLSMTPPPSRAKISEVMNRPNKSPTPTPMDREHPH